MKNKKTFYLVLRLIITAFLLYLIYRRIDLAFIRNLLLTSNYLYLLIAVLIFVLSNVTGAVQWYFLLRSQTDTDPGFFAMIRLYLFSAFFNNFLLSNVGGDVIKVYKLIKYKFDKNIIFSSVLWDRFISVLILIFFSLITGYILFKKVVILYSLALFLGAIILLLILVKKYKLGSFLLKFVNIIRHKKINYFLKEFFLSFKIYLQRSKYIVLFYSFSILTQFLKIFFMVLIAMALSITITPWEIFFIIPIIGVVSALPISINGLGVREYVGSYLFGFLDKEKALMSVFITVGNLVIILGNLFGVIFIFDKNKPKQSPV
ncbi:MAG: flippase-like domain-containing protein [Spirochaetes bacterium]|nr:flippase-like domain-containing protein [Spirochaetota bacterium]